MNEKSVQMLVSMVKQRFIEVPSPARNVNLGSYHNGQITLDGPTTMRHNNFLKPMLLLIMRFNVGPH